MAINKNDIIPEGWVKGHLKTWKMTDEQRLKISKGHKGLKYKYTPEQALAKSNAMKGNSATTGKIWITDGNISKYILLNSEVPEGWKRGRTRKTLITN